MSENRDVAAEIAAAIPCHAPRCNGFLVKRTGKFGAFYGCTNYPTCKATMPLEMGDSIIGERVYGVVDEDDLYLEPDY